MIKRYVQKELARLRYRRSVRQVTRIQASNRELLDEGFFSQCGQDRFIAERLGFMRGGVFVDIGAHDGVRFSNSYFLEKQLGWTGVAVEPLPNVFHRLKASRSCRVVNACVSDVDGTVEFLSCHGVGEMLSGIVSRHHPQHRDRIATEQRDTFGTRKVIRVESMSPNRLFVEHVLDQIDYLSIDTEGSEWDILSAINFDAHPIRLITVENNYGDLRFQQLLNGAGFRLIALIGADEVYENISFSRADKSPCAT